MSTHTHRRNHVTCHRDVYMHRLPGHVDYTLTGQALNGHALFYCLLYGPVCCALCLIQVTGGMWI